MTKVSIVGPDEGEFPLPGPSLRIIEDGSNTGHRLGLAEITLVPHFAGPPQHRHAEHDEGFYVLSGRVRFTLGTAVHDAGPGTWVLVPPGAPHTFENVTDQPAAMLNTFTPDLYVQYFRDLGDLIRSGRPVTDEAHLAVMAPYATEPSTEFVADA